MIQTYTYLSFATSPTQCFEFNEKLILLNIIVESLVLVLLALKNLDPLFITNHPSYSKNGFHTNHSLFLRFASHFSNSMEAHKPQQSQS